MPIQMVGTFAFRFSGYAMGMNVMPYYIAGLGVMVLNRDGTLVGSQRSSITRLGGSGAHLDHSEFKLEGRYEFEADGTGQANITFTSDDQVLDGSFQFVVADSLDRFWMISSGATIVRPDENLIANEVVSGEAVRMPAFSPSEEN